MIYRSAFLTQYCTAHTVTVEPVRQTNNDCKILTAQIKIYTVTLYKLTCRQVSRLYYTEGDLLLG